MKNNNNKFKLALYKVIAPLTFSMAISNLAYGHGLLKIYQLAAKKDPQLQQAFADFKSVEQNIPIAVADLLPEVTLNAGISYDKLLDFTNPGGSNTVNSRYFSANLTQPLFYWDKINRYLQSELEVQKSIHDLEVAKENLLTRVSEAYFNVLEAEDTLEFVSTERNSVKQLYDEAQERFDVGLIPIADVDEAKARYDLQTAEEIDAKNQVLARYDELMEIVGENVEHLSVLTPKFKPSNPKPTEVKKWLQMAMDRNHSYASQKLNSAITEKSEDIAFAGHMPYADATAQYRGVKSSTSMQIDDVSSAKGYLNSYGGAINGGIEIFGGGGTQAAVEQAEFNTLAEGYKTEQVRRETISNTSQVYRNVMTNIQQISALEQAVASSLSALEATRASYEVGSRASIDVLDRLTDLYEQKQKLSQARYSYIKNVIELKRLAGVLTNNDIITIDQWLIAKRANAKKLDNSDVKSNIMQTIKKVDQQQMQKVDTNLSKSTTPTEPTKQDTKTDPVKDKPKDTIKNIKKDSSLQSTEKSNQEPIQSLENKLQQLEQKYVDTTPDISETKDDNDEKETNSIDTKKTKLKAVDNYQVIDTSSDDENKADVTDESNTEPSGNNTLTNPKDLPFDTRAGEDKILKNLENELLKSIDRDYKKDLDADDDNKPSKVESKPQATNTNKSPGYLEPVEDTSNRHDAAFASEEKEDKVLQELESELMRIINQGNLNN